ncbi:MAG: bactofilin family protein [Woeseiaceae bacterium]
MSESNNRRLRDATSGPGTLISEGCKVEGMLRGAGHFMINGEVEGECDVKGSVTLAQGGIWKGVIRADSVIIAGTIDGDIIAAGQVEISDTARISGTVSGEAIAVAEGAVVEGVMKTTGQSEPQGFIEKRRDEDDAE